jgi:lipid-A-disaccharide synthase
MRIMLSCGEASGDLYAGALAAELRARAPAVEMFGLGGPRLAAAGADLIGEFAGLTVTGLTEALRVIPRSYAMYRRLLAAARERRPAAFVAIDFPDFNFRLVAALQRLGVPVVYYVSPQLWAWRPGRMDTMKRFVTRVLVIFPFEAPLYERAGIPVDLVGHPLVDLARPTQSRGAFLAAHRLSPDAPIVALLPGSRPNEVRQIAPVLADALPLIRAHVPSVQFVVARASNLGDELFAPLVKASEPAAAGPHENKVARAGADVGAGSSRLVTVEGRTDDVLAASDVVITASGTATVQAALHERPMVVVYRLSPLTYRLGKPFLKVDTYAMPNLVAGRRVVPELIQEGFTGPRVAEETLSLLLDTHRHARMREDLRVVRERLGPPGASARAATAILEVAARQAGGSTPA